jgi:hypothetical protein
MGSQAVLAGMEASLLYFEVKGESPQGLDFFGVE